MDESKSQVSRLYRSRGDRMISGVCGGLAQYFAIDPVLVRVAFVALGIATGVGLLAYIVLAIVVPERPIDEDEPGVTRRSGHGGSEVFAYILVFVGASILVNNLGLFNFIDGDVLWPMIIIGVGALLLLQRTQRDD